MNLRLASSIAFVIGTLIAGSSRGIRCRRSRPAACHNPRPVGSHEVVIEHNVMVPHVREERV